MPRGIDFGWVIIDGETAERLLGHGDGFDRRAESWAWMRRYGGPKHRNEGPVEEPGRIGPTDPRAGFASDLFNPPAIALDAAQCQPSIRWPSLLSKQAKFTDLKITLPEKTIKIPDAANPGSFVEKTLEAATINYGNFLQNAFDFLIIAFCVFMLVKVINSMQKKAAEAPPAPPEPSPTEKLLAEIRDTLKTKA